MPNSRILIHQPATEGIYGQVSDLEIQAAEISRMRKLLEAMLAKHTGKTPEQVRTDIERDKILTAAEAKEYGIIDEIIQSRKLSGRLTKAVGDGASGPGRAARPASRRPIRSACDSPRRRCRAGTVTTGSRHGPGRVPDGTGVCTHGTHR